MSDEKDLSKNSTGLESLACKAGSSTNYSRMSDSMLIEMRRKAMVDLKGARERDDGPGIKACTDELDRIWEALESHV